MKQSNFIPLISWVDLFVTEQCNLHCKYCFHVQHPREMQEETFEAIIKTLKPKLSEAVTWNFFGGEPLLRVDTCIRWMDRLKQEFPQCNFHVSTNATQWNDSVERFITKLRDDPRSIFQVSYDGINQDELRGQRAVVEKNIKRYIKTYLPKVLNIRLTYTRETVKDLYENARYVYEEIGARKFMHQTQLSKDWTEEDYALYKEQLEKIYNYLDAHHDYSLHFCDCDRVVDEKENGRCGVGRSLVAVDAIGDIYPCQRLIKFPQLKIGNVHKGILNRGKFLNLNIVGCDKCKAVNTCHSCMAANYEYNGSMVEPLEATCVINRLEYDKMLAIYEQKYPELVEAEGLINKAMQVLADVRQGNEILLKVLNA